MAHEADASEVAAPEASGGRGLFFWIKIAALGLVVLLAAGAGWYFFLGGRGNPGAETKVEPEPSLPFFVEIKPFVVTMPNAEGQMHYVQLGINLKMTGAAAGDAVAAVLPEVQDSIRQAVLGYKLEDIQTADGVDKMRQLLVARVNGVLEQALGRERVKRLSTRGDGAMVQNIYFTTLVIE